MTGSPTGQFKVEGVGVRLPSLPFLGEREESADSVPIPEASGSPFAPSGFSPGEMGASADEMVAEFPQMGEPPYAAGDSLRRPGGTPCGAAEPPGGMGAPFREMVAPPFAGTPPPKPPSETPNEGTETPREMGEALRGRKALFFVKSRPQKPKSAVRGYCDDVVRWLAGRGLADLAFAAFPAGDAVLAERETKDAAHSSLPTLAAMRRRASG